MHPYSTNSPANPKLIAVLALVSSAVSVGIGLLLKQINDAFGWTVGGVSALACFGVLYFVFDRYSWRWPIARRFLLVPDLNGTWRCAGRTTSRAGKAADIEWVATITIRQSWSRMVVRLKTSQSESESIAASLYQESGRGYRLIYHYDNKPGVGERDLHRHSGQCDLVFADDGMTASGEYFTGQGRLTVGTMNLTRLENANGTA